MILRTRVLMLTLFGLFALGATTLVSFGCILLDPRPREVFFFERDSAMDCILEWGQVKPLPSSAMELQLSQGGGPFTRSFSASFIAPPGDIEEWLKKSPGTRDVTPITPSPGVRKFKITPGGGANFAEVTVDDIEHQVRVRVEWS